MSVTADSAERLVSLFRKRKVLTKDELLEVCECSTMTLWRALKRVGYLTSYNENARYYTLERIPVFDEEGLWRYRKARFSRYGSLPQTLVGLVAESVSGYEARELSAVLGVTAAPQLSRLHRLGRIAREKLGASFIYVSSEESRKEAQLERRAERLRVAEEQSRLPVRETILAILVELVKSPGLQPEALARRLTRRGIPVTRSEVRNVFTRYDLPGKKGL